MQMDAEIRTFLVYFQRHLKLVLNPWEGNEPLKYFALFCFTLHFECTQLYQFTLLVNHYLRMELLNIRFHFLCSSTHANGDGQSPIVLRVIYRGQRKDVFTGLYCEIMIGTQIRKKYLIPKKIRRVK